MYERATVSGKHFGTDGGYLQGVGKTGMRAQGGSLSDLGIFRQIIVKDGEAKLRIVQLALRQVKEIAAVISRDRKMRELAGEIWRKYGVG